ncbi:hypothetical protein LIX60_24870 [Streptomyces sp. S07_1.15]|uniref:hypothetical protein n=1 Tax=Streptomyces sp. S07_1.15 TaxID=2873925 RepID=UPI001D13CA4E|nr:hypothetical protein [Streptomyces sp. S07_1.15]MCC3654640.1 hypothetical protein [Streptomyces sp. S07_1.15]
METVSAVALMSVMTAAGAQVGSEAARQALEQLSSLVRRAFHRERELPGAPPDSVPDLTGAGPEDFRRYAEILVSRAEEDGELAALLAAWVQHHRTALGVPEADAGPSGNTVSGNARIGGPLVQGRDFHGGITFGGGSGS